MIPPRRPVRRLHLIAAVVLIVSLVSFQSSLSENVDLMVAPGIDGFVSTWMQLGPVRAPAGIRRGQEGIAGWDPVGIGGLERLPLEGERIHGDRWKIVAASRAATRLKGSRPGVAYLATSIYTERARDLVLATGNSGGLEVWLNGTMLMRRDTRGRAVADIEKVGLKLTVGNNLLVLRTWKSGKKGSWTVFARLLDHRYRRPRGVRLVYPGAARGFQGVLKKAAVLSVDREVDLDSGSLTLRYWLDFPGGCPVGRPLSGKLSTLGPNGLRPRDIEIQMSEDGLAFDLLGSGRYEGGKCPHTVRLEFGGTVLERKIGVNLGHVGLLAEAHADLRGAKAHGNLPRTSLESVEWRVDHLKKLIEAGDGDFRYIGREAKLTANMASVLARGKDPYANMRAGIQRRGYRSSVDGKLHHYAMYVPPGWREKGNRKFGLVVTLHGLNSYPMKSLTSLFGVPLADGESKEQRVRNPGKVGPGPMFAVAPEGFGNSGYKAFGERDVVEVIDRVVERYRIDPDRVYITGASMGGTGAASIPLHFPDRFAAIAPLCGYHSLKEYASLRRVDLQPWEEFLAEFRSNARWSRNGRHLPLYVVHGTRDGLRHSKSLVEAFRLRGFRVIFETPTAGHNVWDQTYADRRIFDHFAKYRRSTHPRKVTVHTSRLRYRKNHWLEIDDVSDYAGWSMVDGVWNKENRVVLTTQNVTALVLGRDPKLAANGTPTITIDGEKVEPGGASDGVWRFHRAGDLWRSGRAKVREGLRKRPGLAGPMFDAYYEPLVFVYGTANPDETALSRMVVEKIRAQRSGTTVDWPVKADVEITEADIASHSLVLVGTVRGNGVLGRIADRLPVRVEGGAITVKGERYEGDAVAASFIYPNPLNTDRYVVVHTGVTPGAVFYAANLPELLPDYLVYDGTDWARTGGLALVDRKVLAGGFFDRNWK